MRSGVGRQKAAELKGLFRKEHKSKGMELIAVTVTDVIRDMKWPTHWFLSNYRIPFLK
jgi:hypothetical protein